MRIAVAALVATCSGMGCGITQSSIRCEDKTFLFPQLSEYRFVPEPTPTFGLLYWRGRIISSATSSEWGIDTPPDWSFSASEATDLPPVGGYSWRVYRSSRGFYMVYERKGPLLYVLETKRVQDCSVGFVASADEAERKALLVYLRGIVVK